jgi:predicted 3-demethylubiquinone-9 3-methyltransferase (glyoxalase superfamily)
MKHTLFPCIWYDGNALEAANLYCSAFANSAINDDNGMVISFTLNGEKFMGLNGGAMFSPNATISFMAVCETEDEIDIAWQKLSEEGKIFMPLKKYPWSEKYGWVQDKYGVSWQLMLGKLEQYANKFSPALMLTGANAGKAEEAMQFYVSLFDNSLVKDISRYEKGEPDVEGFIKHGRFSLNNKSFIAMDSTAAHGVTFTEGVSFVITCDTQMEIDYYWQKLTADGGQESMCGWCKDKYGVSWQVVPAILGELMNNPATRDKTVQAFMQMKKFEIDKLL